MSATPNSASASAYGELNLVYLRPPASYIISFPLYWFIPIMTETYSNIFLLKNQTHFDLLLHFPVPQNSKIPEDWIHSLPTCLSISPLLATSYSSPHRSSYQIVNSQFSSTDCLAASDPVDHSALDTSYSFGFWDTTVTWSSSCFTVCSCSFSSPLLVLLLLLNLWRAPGYNFDPFLITTNIHSASDLIQPQGFKSTCWQMLNLHLELELLPLNARFLYPAAYSESPFRC